MRFTVEDVDQPVMFYHKGDSLYEDYDRKSFRRKAPAGIDKKVIAWDMEGMSLSGQDIAQHPVVWGCSLHVDQPLVICSPDQRLSSRDMLEYIIRVGEANPHALHIGFGFRYDANMLIAGLGRNKIESLWKTGRVRFRFDTEFMWSIRWVPGKMFTVTKRWGKKRNSRAKVSVTIYDFVSFFGKKFIDVCEDILREDLSEEDRKVIEHGKSERGSNAWEDLSDVLYYWRCEIVLMRRVFEKFRKVMHDAGFALKEWYGPGALANYINATKGIRPVLSGVQRSGGLSLEPHEAAKIAFSGGRFELFQAGRIRGPIWTVDINSAYPYALAQLPTFENGFWLHRENPSTVVRFGIYRITYKDPSATPFQFKPQPLFWRDHRGLISYPSVAHGWYYSPEAKMVQNMPGVTIHEGWEWIPEDPKTRPWAFLQEMYNARQEIGKKNLLSMPFKLGPNSLYGKYAQTVGWNQETNEPPRSHALPVAGWVTSYCRAMLWTVMNQSPSNVIGVETDSVFLTKDPTTLDITIGDGLGEWGVTKYDEMIYLQSGMYHTRQGEQWQGVKSRGMSAVEMPYASTTEYLRTLGTTTAWDPMVITTRPKFIGAGAAIASSESFAENFCSWRSQRREIGIGTTGKRIHNHNLCLTCASGIGPDVAPHRLFVNSLSDGTTLSHPRTLPWETNYPKEVQEIRDQIAIENEMSDRK